jgi:hypothetical protein
MPDLSPNCNTCGANPHEECRLKGCDAPAINCIFNASAHDSRRDDAMERSPVEMIDEMSRKGNGGFLDFGMLEKMDPMARRALASMEAMQQAIAHNNTDDVAKHIGEAKNALAILERDLDLHKSMAHTATIAKSDDSGVLGHGQVLGNVAQHRNTVSDYDGTEGATVLGVSRYGRSTTFWRPQQD